MKYTDKERFAMPERRPVTDPADVEPLADNFKRIDERFQTMEADKAGRDELKAHAEKKTIDHPDGSVTDEKIGNRTIGGLTGKLAALFSAIGNAIKSITGTENWNDVPDTTLKDAKAHIDDTVRHLTADERVRWGDTYTKLEADANVQIVQDEVTAHKADAVKHLTADERAAWGDKYTKSETEAKLDFKFDTANVTQTLGNSTDKVPSEKAVSEAVAESGGGDMRKSIYDTDNSGSVDSADKITTPRTITMSGDISGSAAFDGSADTVIEATVQNGVKKVSF